MAKVISINNYKGGSGKTSASINVAYELSKRNHKVLLIDLDPQGDASSKFFKDFKDRKGICEALTFVADVQDCISKAFDNLDVLTSNNNLNAISDEMQRSSKIAILKKLIDKVKDNYDYVILDNNPKLNIILTNCIYSSDYIIVPVNIDNNAVKGANNIIESIMDVINNAPIDINVDIRILMTMVTMSKGKPTNIADLVINAMKLSHGKRMFSTYIRMQPKAAQKSSLVTSYFAAEEENKLSEDYKNLVNEIEELN